MGGKLAAVVLVAPRIFETQAYLEGTSLEEALKRRTLHFKELVEMLLDILREVVLGATREHLKHNLNRTRRLLIDSDVERCETAVVRIDYREVVHLGFSNLKVLN